MHDALSVRWMSACLAGGLLLSAYACGGGGSDGNDDGGSGGSGGSGGNGGDSAGGSAGENGSGGSDGGSGGTSSTTDSGGTTSTGGSAGDGGTGGMPEIDCTEDADCENADMVCDPLSEVCVGCLFDTDCGSGERCEGTACVDAVDCTSASDCDGVTGAEACDFASGHCVECVYPSDCPGTADCIDNQCRPYQSCSNSLDCPTPRVCNTSTARCVQCVSSVDCEDGLTCVSSTCRRECDSDNDCTSLGLLCDPSFGACSRCVTDSDCPGVYHCASGRCELDACEQGSGYCEGSGMYSCNSSGSAYQYTSCYYGTTCVEAEQVTCEPWVCTPSTTECNGAATAVVTCSADGLSIESSIDCSETDQVCYQGTCQELECAPSMNFCDGDSIYTCAYDGLSSTLYSTCPSGTFCDPNLAQCIDLLCEPDGPACNGTVATTCNAAGDGYLGGGTDCADTEEFCVDGECRECNGSILFLTDNDSTGNAAMQTALEDAGLVVNMIAGGVQTYTGTPAASDFGAVVYAPGTLYSSSMAQAGQDALVAAQAAGTGFVANELAAYQMNNLGANPTLVPLTLMDWVTSTTTTSYTLTASGHPIWDGLPTTITITSQNASVGPLLNSGEVIATCLNCDSSGAYPGAGVIVREGTGGRLVSLNQWGNYTGSLFYTDANLITMFVNAAQWAAGCK